MIDFEIQCFRFCWILGVPKGPKSRTLRALFSYLFSNTFLDNLSSVCWSRDMRFARHGAVETHVGRFERGTQNPSKMEPFGSQNRPKISKNCSRLNKCESTLRAATKAQQPQLNPSAPHCVPPQKPSPKGFLQVIHLSKYLISTSPSIHPSIH